MSGRDAIRPALDPSTPTEQTTRRQIAISPFNRVELVYHGVVHYAHAHNLRVPDVDFSQVVADEERGRQIAAAYEAAPVYDLAAIPAYRAFIGETVRQFEFLTRPMEQGGLGIEVVVWSRDPYPGPAAMLVELRERRRLRVYSTEACDNPHPYLSDHENDMFRAVHDAFGHAATGQGFDPDGEEAAWLAHSHLYTSLARRTLTTETRGQQNAMLYGPGEGFPRQKLCLLSAAFAELTNVNFRDVPA
jgi:hypothetical protein